MKENKYYYETLNCLCVKIRNLKNKYLKGVF